MVTSFHQLPLAAGYRPLHWLIVPRLPTPKPPTFSQLMQRSEGLPGSRSCCAPPPTVSHTAGGWPGLCWTISTGWCCRRA